MKNVILKIVTLVTCSFMLVACTENEAASTASSVNWEKRKIEIPKLDSITKGTTYLSVYSHIYSVSEHRSQDLTATISIRNTNRADTVYINRAEYYNTGGELIRTYFDQPIFIAPMETVEIIIHKSDIAGGSGANFLFDWTIKEGIHEPFFEAVMISMSSSLGISFVTKGIRVD